MARNRRAPSLSPEKRKQAKEAKAREKREERERFLREKADRNAIVEAKLKTGRKELTAKEERALREAESESEPSVKKELTAKEERALRDAESKPSVQVDSGQKPAVKAVDKAVEKE